ncbi:hypothetical protein OH76DRAFT_948785 [Lentinus brumalis]|uniref:Uncharacterized protein n=1 Tax=Lentinus brumalis TaxID=2498619 RepID=A0A371CZ86_9APHY|nr:hypothetical protein OH76DRAFT_948785 [Polyporus brumalis]
MTVSDTRLCPGPGPHRQAIGLEDGRGNTSMLPEFSQYSALTAVDDTTPTPFQETGMKRAAARPRTMHPIKSQVPPYDAASLGSSYATWAMHCKRKIAPRSLRRRMNERSQSYGPWRRHGCRSYDGREREGSPKCSESMTSHGLESGAASSCLIVPVCELHTSTGACIIPPDDESRHARAQQTAEAPNK